MRYPNLINSARQLLERPKMLAISRLCKGKKESVIKPVRWLHTPDGHVVQDELKTLVLRAASFCFATVASIIFRRHLVLTGGQLVDLSGTY